MSTIYTLLPALLLRYLLLVFLSSAATPAAAQYRILALGNSITQGNVQHPSYRFRLWQKLVSADTDVEFVGSHDINNGGSPPEKGTVLNGKTYTNLNEGHWGWTTDEILNGKDGQGKLSEWLQTYTPDIALIHLGSNDMFRQCSSGVSENKACYRQTINELRNVVKRIREKNPNVTIFMAQLIPAYGQKVGPEIAANIVELNKRIPALVNELNTGTSPVILVDQFSGFDPTEGVDTHDGVHPNSSGEEKMAQRWFEALNPVIVALPVELAFFTARSAHRGSVVLDWQTASEIGNAYFEVQRSPDGEDFQALGRVKGAGTSAAPQHYTYTDSAAEAGTRYYRLKQVDIGGTSSYSAVVQAQVEAQEENLRIYPTRGGSDQPITLHLQHGQPNAVAEVHIYTSEGKLVQRLQNLKGQNGTVNAKISTAQLLGAGLYLVRAVAGNKVYFSEFLVER